MKRKDLLNLIDRAMNVEEEAVHSLSKHISSAMKWSGFTAEESKRVEDVLTLLTRETLVHKQILETLRKKVVEGNKEDI